MLTIKNLTVTVNTTKILDDVSLSIEKGKIIGLVGASGSGKTTLASSILQILPQAMQVVSGNIMFEGKDLLKLKGEDLRLMRGKQIGTIFQEPSSAFDPLFTIGQQLDETLVAHTDLGIKERQQRISDTLKRVELDDVERIINSYPHQLSGGLRQRAMIAQALICQPAMIVADEPTSSLDVTVQAKIIALLKKINHDDGVTILLITHDLGLVGYMADQVAVMNQGVIVEHGNVKAIINQPKDPYTKELLRAF